MAYLFGEFGNYHGGGTPQATMSSQSARSLPRRPGFPSRNVPPPVRKTSCCQIRFESSEYSLVTSYHIRKLRRLGPQRVIFKSDNGSLICRTTFEANPSPASTTSFARDCIYGGLANIVISKATSTKLGQNLEAAFLRSRNTI